MTWSLVIMDNGITNRLQARAGKPTVAEWDFYDRHSETDDGIRTTHGNSVLLSALGVSRAYDVVDFKVATPVYEASYTPQAIEAALRSVLASAAGPTVGAINMSFGGYGYPHRFADEIDQLAARGVLCVVAAGNDGTSDRFERALYPAALPSVICVGSHDGNGRPSFFSSNGRMVDVLADGENVPRPGSHGTSFAAPQVAATVTHVQAIVDGLTGDVLGAAAMIGVLQQGGAGPRSRPDPADGRTRYFLHDHDGSLDYAWSHYGGTPTLALEYIASHPDLIFRLGADARAGQLDYERQGSIEQRAITFDALDYIASHGDLITAFGTNADAGASHYIHAGYGEGRTVTFDGLEYIASHDDLIAVYGPNEQGGADHFIRYGFGEDRDPDRFDAAQYLANNPDLQAAFGTDLEAATLHFITNGIFEGRSDEAVAAAGDFLL